MSSEVTACHLDTIVSWLRWWLSLVRIASECKFTEAEPMWIVQCSHYSTLEIYFRWVCQGQRVGELNRCLLSVFQCDWYFDSSLNHWSLSFLFTDGCQRMEPQWRHKLACWKQTSRLNKSSGNRGLFSLSIESSTEFFCAWSQYAASLLTCFSTSSESYWTASWTEPYVEHQKINSRVVTGLSLFYQCLLLH